MAFTVFYTVQISDVATKIFEAAGGKAVVTNHFFDEAGYIEELKALKPEAIMCRTEPITAAMMDAAGPNLKVIGKQGRIAKAIRAVVKAAASKEDKKIVVDILQ